MKYKLRLAISSCPNDTFIAYGLIHQKVKNKILEFEVQLLDIEQLNNIALANNADIIKISTAIIPEITTNYKILNSGAALGFNCGPLVISKTNTIPINSNIKIGIPGFQTTAYKLFQRYFGNNFIIKPYVFYEIEDAINRDEIDAGVIIHENRFTYEKKGLKKVCDLGEKWQNDTNLPIPLGCFAISKNIEQNVMIEIDNALKESINYAFNNNDEVMKFVRKHAQTMSDEVAQKHISLYVNTETLSLSNVGKQSIIKFVEESNNKNSCTFDERSLFI